MRVPAWAQCEQAIDERDELRLRVSKLDALREAQEQVRLALIEAARDTTDGNDTRADGYAAGLHKALYLFPDAALPSLEHRP